MAELVDAADSKSASIDRVPVQVRMEAPFLFLLVDIFFMGVIFINNLNHADREAFQRIQDDILDMTDKFNKLISFVEATDDGNNKIYNIIILFNNKMCEIYNYIQNKGHHFSRSLIANAINNYFISLLNMACLYLARYVRIYVQNSERKLKKNKGDVKECLDKYIELCSAIENYSFERDTPFVIERNKNMIIQQGINVDVEKLTNDMNLELISLIGDKVNSDEKSSVINDSYDFSEIKNELEICKKMNSKK